MNFCWGGGAGIDGVDDVWLGFTVVPVVPLHQPNYDKIRSET